MQVLTQNKSIDKLRERTDTLKGVFTRIVTKEKGPT